MWEQDSGDDRSGQSDNKYLQDNQLTLKPWQAQFILLQDIAYLQVVSRKSKFTVNGVQIRTCPGDDRRQILVVSPTKQGRLLIKWGGPKPACHVPSADTFAQPYLDSVSLWWQIFNTNCPCKPIPQPTFNSSSSPMILNFTMAKATFKALF